MYGKPYQVKLLLDLVERKDAFTAPELAQRCYLPQGLVNNFITGLRRRGVVLPLPRPEEPREWAEIYGQMVLRRKRREVKIIGPNPLTLNRGRLRVLADEGCSCHEVFSVLEEADG
jgi:hypothetical protein